LTVDYRDDYFNEHSSNRMLNVESTGDIKIKAYNFLYNYDKSIYPTLKYPEIFRLISN
jgi:hypothetical protein